MVIMQCRLKRSWWLNLPTVHICPVCTVHFFRSWKMTWSREKPQSYYLPQKKALSNVCTYTISSVYCHLLPSVEKDVCNNANFWNHISSHLTKTRGRRNWNVYMWTSGPMYYLTTNGISKIPVHLNVCLIGFNEVILQFHFDYVNLHGWRKGNIHMTSFYLTKT